MNRPQQQESHRYASASNDRADAAVSPRVVTDNEGVEPAVLVLREPLHPVERRRSSNISFERHMLGLDDAALGLLMDLDNDDTTEASTVDFDEDDLLEDEEDIGTFLSRFGGGEGEERQVIQGNRENETTARPSSAIIPSSFFLGTTGQPRQERTRVDNAVLDSDSVQSHNNQFHDSSSMISKTEDEIIAKAIACGKLLDEEGTAGRSSSLFGTAGSSFRRHYFARPPADNDEASSGGDENSKCVSATDSHMAAAASRVQDDILAALQELNKLGCNDQEEGNKGTSSSGDVKATIIKKADNKDGPSSKKGSSPLQNLPGCDNEREEGAMAMAVKMAQVSAPPPPRMTMLDP